jgi:DNA-binding HxlR family transcriptional regulator
MFIPGYTVIMVNDALPHADPGACSGAPSAKLAMAFMLLQEKWALFIIHSLFKGPNGFNEMSRMAGPVNVTTLAQRLTRLEQAGLITKTVQSTMPPRTSYALTEAGQALRPIVDAIGAWSERYLLDQPPECPEP